MVMQQYTCAYGTVSPQDGCFDSLVLPQVNSECMQLFIDEVASRHPNDNIVMALDGAGWHKCKDFHLPDHLRLLFLPPYSPELNPQEHLWDELREKHFHNRVFDRIDALEDHLVAARREMEYAQDRAKALPDGTGLLIPFLVRIRSTWVRSLSYVHRTRPERPMDSRMVRSGVRQTAVLTALIRV